MSDYFQQAEEEGRKAALAGATESDNPYEESGHERDTTFDDECHYRWWRGFIHAHDEEEYPETD